VPDLERAAVGPDDALAALDVALLVADERADLDDVARDAVVEDLDGLPDGDAAREELDHVARLEDDVRVVRLARRAHGHRAVDEVERARDALRARVSLAHAEGREKGHTCVSSARVTADHTSRRYFSRYLGKRVANEDSSVNVPPLLSSGLNGSTFHWGMHETISLHYSPQYLTLKAVSGMSSNTMY
jgi:hypothetical protein